jgi:hypothetical protein
MFSFGDPGYRTLVSRVKRCAFPARIGVPDRVKVLQERRPAARVMRGCVNLTSYKLASGWTDD